MLVRAVRKREWKGASRAADAVLVYYIVTHAVMNSMPAFAPMTVFFHICQAVDVVGLVIFECTPLDKEIAKMPPWIRS